MLDSKRRWQCLPAMRNVPMVYPPLVSPFLLSYLSRLEQVHYLASVTSSQRRCILTALQSPQRQAGYNCIVCRRAQTRQLNLESPVKLVHRGHSTSIERKLTVVTAPFEAAYQTRFGLGRGALMLLMLMNRPGLLLSRQYGTQTLELRYRGLTLIFHIRSTSSSESSMLGVAR